LRRENRQQGCLVFIVQVLKNVRLVGRFQSKQNLNGLVKVIPLKGILYPIEDVLGV
jgi:hypothetical protein